MRIGVLADNFFSHNRNSCQYLKFKKLSEPLVNATKKLLSVYADRASYKSVIRTQFIVQACYDRKNDCETPSGLYAGRTEAYKTEFQNTYSIAETQNAEFRSVTGEI